MSGKSFAVHKFGGTSVGTADSIRKCIEIVKTLVPNNRIAMVVSAMGGQPKVTDMLLDSVHASASVNEEKRDNLLVAILDKHSVAIKDLLPDHPNEVERLIRIVQKDLEDIHVILKAVQLLQNAGELILELISGYGELWSAQVLASVMQSMGMPFEFLNARDVIRIRTEGGTGQMVDWEMSQHYIDEVLAAREKELGYKTHFVITGFVATTTDGVATTLKRDGSDYSASIFGYLLKADAITIWTDVSGVYSADPRRVRGAQVITQVSYNEAIELSYFGAKVIHPKTVTPAIMANIPIYIKNTFEPSAAGTRIYQPPSQGEAVREKTVCGFSTVDNVALLNIDGNGMVGVSGIALRLFSALEDVSVPVLFIAQASSEHSICFATRESHALAAKEAIESKFHWELSKGLITKVTTIRDCSIIAAVGDSMGNMPGVSGIFFNALGNARINILSISQGCNERNISAVVLAKDSARALQVVHAAFWLSSHSISIGVVGTGNVGSAVIQTLLEQAPLFRHRFDLNLSICGAINEDKMILGDDLSDDLMAKLSVFKRKISCELDGTTNLTRTHSNLSLEDMAEAMNAPLDRDGGTQPADLEKFVAHVSGHEGSPHCILIDCTDSKSVAACHSTWIRKGAHVVTANKSAVTRDIGLYNEILDAKRKFSRSYFSEVTIGSSVPIMTTLNDILVSGDAVHGIVGIMNVSCQTVLTLVMEGVSLTDALGRVYDKGLFEPDPWEDLCGIEAASKILILARVMGLPLNIEDIKYEPLVTRKEGVNFPDIRSSKLFEDEDKELKRRALQAKANNCTLRYVQRLKCAPAAEMGVHKDYQWETSVALEEVPLDTDLAIVKGPIYFFSFHTERCKQSPLCIKGPLSDATNTASGIVGDILRIAKSIGVTDKGQHNLEHHLRL